jgi:hypothetical protein
VKAGSPIEFGPPIAVLGQTFFAPIFPIHQHARPAFVAVSDRALRVVEFLQVPIPADARMEDFIGLIIVLENRGERVVRGAADLPFEALAVLGHETLFDKIEHGMPFDRLELGV